VSGTWVGVDPGGRSTGIVVRHGYDLLGWMILDRTDDDDEGRSIGVGAPTIQAVNAAITNALATAGPGAHLAVEGVTPPVGFKDGKREPIDPRDTIATGVVLGGILAAHPDAVVVRPNSHGRGTLAAYPEGLITPAERRHGLNRKAGKSASERHARAAWDVAGAGPLTLAAIIRHRQQALTAAAAGFTTRRPR
jgi:hypothetical protein